MMTPQFAEAELGTIVEPHQGSITDKGTVIQFLGRSPCTTVVSHGPKQRQDISIRSTESITSQIQSRKKPSLTTSIISNQNKAFTPSFGSTVSHLFPSMAGSDVFEDALKSFKSRLSPKESQDFSKLTTLNELKAMIVSSKKFTSLKYITLLQWSFRTTGFCPHSSSGIGSTGSQLCISRPPLHSQAPSSPQILIDYNTEDAS